jgi:hypothetical protein
MYGSLPPIGRQHHQYQLYPHSHYIPADQQKFEVQLHFIFFKLKFNIIFALFIKNEIIKLKLK